MSLPVASSMPACSDMALSCPLLGQRTLWLFGSYRALRGSQTHFQVWLELRDWTAGFQQPFYEDIPPMCRSVLFLTHFT